MVSLRLGRRDDDPDAARTDCVRLVAAADVAAIDFRAPPCAEVDLLSESGGFRPSISTQKVYLGGVPPSRAAARSARSARANAGVPDASAVASIERARPSHGH